MKIADDTFETVNRTEHPMQALWAYQLTPHDERG